MPEFKTYCPKCGGDGFLYEGTGHRASGYPFAEMTACVGVCDACDNAKKPKKPVAVETPEQRDARHDKIIKRALALYEELKP